MNKRVEILLHVAVWAMLFLSPLSFLNHGNGVSLVQYLMVCMSPLIMMLVFYTNYLWLTPTLFVKGEKTYFWLINTLLCVGLGIGTHFWMMYARELFGENAYHRPEPTTLQMMLFTLRDVFNLVVTAAIATTIQLSLRWYKSEQARRDAETARTEAELKNLRNQISPHFLLNTLNNIYALTAFDPQKAQAAIQELSKMLRHMLYNNQEDMVGWEEEIQFLESYVNLMKIRMQQNVKVTFCATTSPAANKQTKVAPLLFISLIENAFKHGISPTEDSFIDIRLNADESQIECNITNSNFPKTAQDRSGHGIGLQQVERRLELAYAGRYQWNRSTSADGKTYQSVITIQL